MLCPEGLPPLPLDLGLARGRGGGVSLDVRPWRASAPLSLLPLRELERGEVARSRRTPPALAASSVASPHSSQHAPRRGELREVSEDRSLARSSRVSRSSEQETRQNRRALVTVAVVLALAPLPVRCQEVESVGGGHLLGLCPPASGRDRRIDTGLAETAFGVTGRGLLTATDRVVSLRVPPLVGRLAVTRSSTLLS